MKETLLLYHMPQSILEKIEDIAKQLHIDIQIIDDCQIHETMGYLLSIEGYPASKPQDKPEDMNQEFIFFAGMSDQQLDILLQLFQMNDIPKIPYKAMLTKHNMNYTFIQLYKSVQNEYWQMSQMSRTD